MWMLIGTLNIYSTAKMIAQFISSNASFIMMLFRITRLATSSSLFKFVGVGGLLRLLVLALERFFRVLNSWLLFCGVSSASCTTYGS